MINVAYQLEELDGFICLLEFHVAHSYLVGKLGVIISLRIGNVVMMDGLLVLPQSEVVGTNVEVGQDIVIFQLCKMSYDDVGIFNMFAYLKALFVVLLNLIDLFLSLRNLELAVGEEIQTLYALRLFLQ